MPIRSCPEGIMLSRSKKLTLPAFWFYLAAAALPTVLGVVSILVMKVAVGSQGVMTYGFQFSRRGRDLGTGATPGTEFTADQLLTAFLPGLAVLGGVALLLCVLFAVRWPVFVLGTLGILTLALAPLNAAMAAVSSGASWGGIVLLILLAVAFVGQRFLLEGARRRVVAVIPMPAADATS